MLAADAAALAAADNSLALIMSRYENSFIAALVRKTGDLGRSVEAWVSSESRQSKLLSVFLLSCSIFN